MAWSFAQRPPAWATLFLALGRWQGESKLREEEGQCLDEAASHSWQLQLRYWLFRRPR
jgi:hypothetical protein